MRIFSITRTLVYRFRILTMTQEQTSKVEETIYTLSNSRVTSQQEFEDVIRSVITELVEDAIKENVGCHICKGGGELRTAGINGSNGEYVDETEICDMCLGSGIIPLTKYTELIETSNAIDPEDLPF